jgi:hypothetical protein
MSATTAAVVEQLQPIVEHRVPREPPYLGADSTTAYMQRLATETGSEVAHDVSPALALASALTWNPFQRYDECNSGFSDLSNLLPNGGSIQR